MTAAATIVAAAVAWAARGGLGLAFADGPPTGVTGGFGEVSCHQCHFDFDPNPAGGSIAVKGLPESFEAGRRYPLTVTVTRPGLKAGGFQLSARFADGRQKGRQAGELRSSGTRARVAKTEAQLAYAQHARGGTDPTGADIVSWTIDWTAPAGAESIAFHVAGVAADGDVSPFGDHVYQRELIIPAR
jgi:hypothetical protein